MTAGPVVVLGLDGLDPSTARAMAEAGELPALASLWARARVAEVENPFGVFVHAVWPSFTTGLRADHHRYRNWNEIDPVTYESRLSDCTDVHGDPFWLTIGHAGRRVAVIDVPHTRARPVNGIEVVEWGTHDRHHGLHSSPPEVAADLEARFGLHPVFGIDPHSDRDFAPDDWVHRVGDIRTAEEDMALLDDFVAGARRKSELVNDVLTREVWDLFVAVYGESHAGGHHLWHHHDRGHPRHDPAVVRRVGDPVTTLYRSLDGAVAAQLAVVDGAATVLVLLSHGMAAHYDASHLLEEILRRVAAVDGGAPGGNRARRMAKGAWRALPPPLRRRAAPLPATVARWVAQRRALTTSWVEVGAADRAAAPFFMEPNNSVYGGVRLNLVGREPNGVVDPGAADDVLERVSVDLLDLVNVATGRPVVQAVHRVEEHHDRWEGDCLPDLFVDWNHDAPVETVWSPKVGLLHGPFGLWRTGDHRPGGLLLAAGPDIEPGVADRLRVIDLGPSIAARLGVELPAADGRAVPWLAGAYATV